MIKKYAKQEGDSSLHLLLKNYSTQAQAFLTRRERKTTQILSKSTLAALIPLAASSVAGAQCQGSQGTVTLNIFSSHSIDIDGGGNDFRFRNGLSTIFLYGLGSNRFIQIGSTTPLGANKYVGRLANGYAITAGQNFVAGAGDTFLCKDFGGIQGNFPPGHSSTDNYIGIKKGTTLGFIRVQVLTCPSGTKTFRIVDMGYDTNSAASVNAGDCAALPVEMLFFRSALVENGIQLNWSTATELDNEGFEIQRSVDGRLFHKIGWVPGHGTTQEQQTYSFTDESLQPNVRYYYRLKQVDTDGQFEFSPMTSEMIKDANQVEVGDFYPNPVSTGFPLAWLQLNVPEAQQGIFQVYNSKGALVKEFEEALHEGQNRLSVRMDGLVAGQYYVKIQIGDKLEYRKFMMH